MILTIRYADPAATPAKHKAQGYGLGVPMVQPGLVNGEDYWTVVGDRDALVAHVNRALHANDLNDYAITAGAR